MLAKLSHTGLMPTLVAITGPIASGKNTVAELLAKRCAGKGLTVVIADVDDVAAMVTGPGAPASGLWFAAHLAHGNVGAGTRGRDPRAIPAVRLSCSSP